MVVTLLYSLEKSARGASIVDINPNTTTYYKLLLEEM